MCDSGVVNRITVRSTRESTKKDPGMDTKDNISWDISSSGNGAQGQPATMLTELGEQFLPRAAGRRDEGTKDRHHKREPISGLSDTRGVSRLRTNRP